MVLYPKPLEQIDAFLILDSFSGRHCDAHTIVMVTVGGSTTVSHIKPFTILQQSI
jgi:hypothetical protein